MGSLVPGTRSVEMVSPAIARGGFRSAILDFDGTISLLREGWREIMIPMMVEVLSEHTRDETEEELAEVVADFVDELTGRQTIYQMLRLCEEVRKRGGKPADPLEYKQLQNERLLAHIHHRMVGLEEGRIHPDELMVPGAAQLLENLAARGISLYLASGTDLEYVRNEARLLGVAHHFGDRIHGALENYRDFSKAKVIEQIITTHNLDGPGLLGFGDGYVEIENTVAVGGVAVGVASDEVAREGVNPWKRERLIGAGAHLIVPEFREQEQLVQYLLEEG